MMFVVTNHPSSNVVEVELHPETKKHIIKMAIGTILIPVVGVTSWYLTNTYFPNPNP